MRGRHESTLLYFVILVDTVYHTFAVCGKLKAINFVKEAFYHADTPSLHPLPPGPAGRTAPQGSAALRSRQHPARGPRRPAPLGGAVPERRPERRNRERHGVFQRLHAEMLLLPELPDQSGRGRQGDFCGAADRDFYEFAERRGEKCKPRHGIAVSAVGHCRAGCRAGAGIFPARRLQHGRV